MKANAFLGVVILAFAIHSCITQQKVFTHNYVFNDSPQRNLVMSFKSDSIFLLRNAVEGDLNYSLIGKWRKIDDRKFVLLNLEGFKSQNQLAPPEGGRIDVIKAYEDKKYIFPSIYLDTLVFDKKHENFRLKGYNFNIGHRL